MTRVSMYIGYVTIDMACVHLCATHVTRISTQSPPPGFVSEAHQLQVLDLPRQEIAGDPPEPLLGIGDEERVFHSAV